MTRRAEDLAQLHARAFAGTGRGWSAAEFAYLLASPLTCVCTAPRGFAMSRVIAGEAELLTLATDPDHRRQGVATDLLGRLEGAVVARGAKRHFLEVAADNDAARALYARAGYTEMGRRDAYYLRPDGSHADALVMEKALRT